MNDLQKTAYSDLHDLAHKISRMIIEVRSERHPLELEPATVERLLEARQALWQAQRIMENCP